MFHPTFAVLVVFEVKSDFIEAFRVRVRQQAEDSLELESDCFQFDVLGDPHSPSVVVLYETYQDRSAFDAHLQTEHFRRFNEETSNWVLRKDVRHLSILS